MAYNLLMPGPGDWATEFRAALSCSVFKVAGAGELNGMHLIKLTPVSPGSVATVYWIDAGTYLPVRAQLTYGGNSTDQQEFQWLPPTAANLKNLDVPIPAGFTRIPPPKNQ